LAPRAATDTDLAQEVGGDFAGQSCVGTQKVDPSPTGHTHDERARSAITRLGGHEAVVVRDAVAITLPSFDLDDDSLEALRRLSADSDDHVRDWATFALAESDARDDSTIEALAARVDDVDDDTRAEGIFGLARRQDPRARALVERELRRPVHGSLIDRALEELNS
jgi:HEAT repeat protein